LLATFFLSWPNPLPYGITVAKMLRNMTRFRPWLGALRLGLRGRLSAHSEHGVCCTTHLTLQFFPSRRSRRSATPAATRCFPHPLRALIRANTTKMFYLPHVHSTLTPLLPEGTRQTTRLSSTTSLSGWRHLRSQRGPPRDANLLIVRATGCDAAPPHHNFCEGVPDAPPF